MVLGVTIKKQDLIYLLLPLITGYSVSAFCSPGKKSGANIKFRPPAWLFGIVWPILYILIGLAWVNSKEQILYFSALIFLLCLWSVVYSCQNNKKGGIYIIFLSLLCLLFLYTNVNKLSKNLLSPLIVWLLFAGLLNIFEVQIM